jgi:predicted  nucleic acid-binding Zn-ribbon protein
VENIKKGNEHLPPKNSAMTSDEDDAQKRLESLKKKLDQAGEALQKMIDKLSEDNKNKESKEKKIDELKTK